MILLLGGHSIIVRFYLTEEQLIIVCDMAGDSVCRKAEDYHGREDIPDEHKVFSMPKLNIREQMAAYKEVIDRSSLEGERLHPRKEVPER